MGVGPDLGPPGQGATLPSVEERYESELTRSAAVLDGVDRALERLSEGTYGTCEVCGAPVLEADLERDPTLRMCEQHLSLR
jgi:DnaK suppressor protein